MVILGLGSNVGDRLLNLAKAVSIITKSVLAGVEFSSVYESGAVIKPNSPESWNKPFLNMAIVGETHLSPTELLKEIKIIEKMLGRNDIGVWSPREIDIDILAYGSLSINTEALTIPHKELCKRPFALLPLAEVAPNWQYPTEGAFKGKTAYEISHQMFLCGAPEAVKTEYSLEAVALQVA
jgi:2-amino-4-hydroxy-6-hydroxymethyldihydropteridine diphosphokinase/dihydropteroate synthase